MFFFSIKNIKLFFDRYSSSIAFLIIFSFITTFFSCQKNNELLIKGKIHNLNSKYILLSHYKGDTIFMDTVQLSNGSFKKHIIIDTLTRFDIHFENASGGVSFYADKSDKIKISGDIKQPFFIEIKGNKINNDVTNFKNENHDLISQKIELIKDFLPLTKKAPVFPNKYLSKLNEIDNELTRNIEEFVKENPSSISSVVLINEFLSNSIDLSCLKKLMAHLKGDALKFPLAQALQRNVEKQQMSEEGAIMPYFETQTLDNKLVRSTDYQGNTLLLSFLSSSDQASAQDMEKIKLNYNILKNDSVKLLSFYIEAENYPIKKNLADSLSWPVVVDAKGWASQVVDAFSVPYLPYHILVSKEGKILKRGILPEDLPKFLRK